MTEQQTSALTDLDTPHFSYWRALYASFFSSALYVDVGKRWKRFAFGYLLLMIFVISLPLGIRVVFVMNDVLNEEIVSPIRNLPELYLQNGKVSLDKPMPYLIKNEQGAVKAIVDTTGKITGMTTQYPDLSILITRDRMLFRMPGDPLAFMLNTQDKSADMIGEYPFPADMNEIFDGKKWLSGGSVFWLKLSMMFLTYPSMVLGLFGVCAVLFLATAFMVQLLAYMFLRFRISYLQAYRLLIVSATPVLALFMLAVAFHLFFTGIGIPLLIIMVLYCGFALISLKRDSYNLVRA